MVGLLIQAITAEYLEGSVYSVLFSVFLVCLMVGTLGCNAVNTMLLLLAMRRDSDPHWTRRWPPQRASKQPSSQEVLLGLEAVFEHVKGVMDVTSGYSGGPRIRLVTR